MAPAIRLDEASDFDVPYAAAPTAIQASNRRTLLLAPPSLAAHPEALDQVYEMHDREHTDLQMLDRLALGLVNLPSATYDVVMLLTDADGAKSESQTLLGRDVMHGIVEALRFGGVLKSQSNSRPGIEGVVRTEAILAGLTEEDGGLVKPEVFGGGMVQLKLGKRKTGPISEYNSGLHETGSSGGAKEQQVPVQPAGVGFVDFGDDLDLPIITGEDDELIDEDDLLTEEDKARPITIPPECRPKTGKRRRACKDCTCGLKEKLDAEDSAKRSAADKALNTMKLKEDELAEVDFTVQGKAGSCGNCALGDAFRCDGCPYVGLPTWKPGEVVRLLNDDIQL